jgi:hypothetical protein
LTGEEQPIHEKGGSIEGVPLSWWEGQGEGGAATKKPDSNAITGHEGPYSEEIRTFVAFSFFGGLNHGKKMD